MEDNSLILNSIFEGILERKGKEIISLNFNNTQNAYYDHFIVCHGDSSTQVSGIADNIERKLNEDFKIKAHHREGTENAFWILLDYSGIIVHIFQEDYRRYYNIEGLWGDADTSRIEESFN